MICRYYRLAEKNILLTLLFKDSSDSIGIIKARRKGILSSCTQRSAAEVYAKKKKNLKRWDLTTLKVNKSEKLLLLFNPSLQYYTQKYT